ncbi:MAG: S8 family serine peptidase [Burkholderiaceae bacterium]
MKTKTLASWRLVAQSTARGLACVSLAVLAACGGGGGGGDGGGGQSGSADTGNGSTPNDGNGGGTAGSTGGGTTGGGANGGTTGGGAGSGSDTASGGTTPDQRPATPTVALPPVGTRLNAAHCNYTYLMASPAAQGSGADPRFVEQWYLSNTGQSGGRSGEDLRALAGWQAAPGKGAGVRIAIVDDAVEVTHQDLSPNVDLSLSHSYQLDAPFENFPLPCAAGTEHGTSVAGIAAARDQNGLGVRGVAPRATLVAYDPVQTRFDADIADALTRELSSISIYNNSWGLPDNGVLQPSPAVYQSAIARGLREGRGGRGAVYLFAAGNGGCYYNDGAGYGIEPTVDDPNHCNSYTDNANFDGFVNQFGVIPVCAVDDEGKRPWYGERGANVLVCGLSSDRGHGTDAIDGSYVTSTTVRNDYTQGFSGTSASTPQVSGVVALMLEQRPELSWRDVRLILARSARQNDPTDPRWVSVNGLHYHPDYAFGTVDAGAAVTLAKSWSSVGGSSTLTACKVVERAPGTSIPDRPNQTTEAAPAVDTMQVSAGDCPISKIEMVQVTFVSDHPYGGDLKIELVSPAGLVSELANSRACFQYPTPSGGAPATPINELWTCRTPQAPYADRHSPGNLDYGESNGGWTFTSARHLDESPLGAWQLRVTDGGVADTGHIVRWKLAIWGR